jgi:hypothetical protein
MSFGELGPGPSVEQTKSTHGVSVNKNRRTRVESDRHVGKGAIRFVRLYIVNGEYLLSMNGIVAKAGSTGTVSPAQEWYSVLVIVERLVDIIVN